MPPDDSSPSSPNGISLNGTAGKGLNGVKPGRSSRRRALIADEDPSVVWLLRRVLADDFDVTVAENGVTAVELAASTQPDVILLDLEMPILDGFGACRMIRAAYPRLPIVIVSGRTDEDAVRLAFEVGATDYLTKPFTSSQLRARLQACLLRSF
jgi:two-component system, OmpR family, response regulator MtrA